jgi:GNAT superfamily N-acetyltransferase
MTEGKMQSLKVKVIEDLLKVNLDTIINESKEEGFRFIERLDDDYKNGINTFNKPGEGIYSVLNKDNELVAIGGMNVDSFSGQKGVGRLRRFYVSKKHRRHGIGSLLLKRIISDAKQSFKIVVLYTDTKNADQFYQSFGFLKGNKYPKSTHYLEL